MATQQLQFPETVREKLTRRFRNQHRDWLAGQGEWPLITSLGCPSEAEAHQHPDAVRAWVTAWQAWQGVGELTWCERRWRSLGTQRLPERLLLSGPGEAAAWLGQTARWERAGQRYDHLAALWPALADRLPRYFDLLADYGEDDFLRLEAMIAWIEANPCSNLYPRQLPIAGLDSKWLDGRKGLIADLLSRLQEGPDGCIDFYQLCGLRPMPATVRLRVLDQSLRVRLGGLGDIAAPMNDLALLDLPVRRVIIAENLQTGLAFGDLPSSVVIMGLGYGVDILAHLPWVMRSSCIYWGDLDTHGFAILSRARFHLPRLKSILMDEATLLSHRELWGKEELQNPASELPLLTDAEQTVYQGLKQQRWGTNVRLEQERIAWDHAWQVIRTS